MEKGNELDPKKDELNKPNFLKRGLNYEIRPSEWIRLRYPSSEHRRLFCPEYDKCLSFAAKKSWAGFTCSLCPKGGKVMPKGDSISLGEGTLTNLQKFQEGELEMEDVFLTILAQNIDLPRQRLRRTSQELAQVTRLLIAEEKIKIVRRLKNDH